MKHKLFRNTKLLSRFCLLLSLVINALCLMIIMEVIARDSYDTTMIWILENTSYAMCTLGFILLALATIVLIIGRVFPALLLCNTALIVAGIIQHFKLLLRGSPIKLSDVLFIKEGFQAALRFVDSGFKITRFMMFGMFAMIVCVPLLYRGVKVLAGHWKIRFASVVALAVLIVVYVPFMTEVTMENAIAWDDHKKRGTLIAFFDEEAIMAEPENYSEQHVRSILEAHAGREVPLEEKPNVLFVMSESLFDMSSDLVLSEEPMPYFKELQNRYWGGTHLSSAYGGGTASVEYEVLTGYRVADTNGLAYFLDIGVIKPDMKSLVSVFNSNGYFTQAIHPNSGAFYNRELVYRSFGFDSALFSDTLAPAPKEVFPFPSDDYLFDEIIRAFKDKPENEPWFCYAITYQNHGGYGFESNLNEIQIRGELANDEHRNARNFINMVKLSDTALRKLIAYFDGVEEPTMIIVFGDHAPGIAQFGLELPTSTPQRMRYQETPVLIYSNYGLDTSILPRKIPSYRLGAYVLRLVGIDCDAYMNYLASDDIESLTCFDGWIEREGEYIQDFERYRAEADRMYTVHYDRLIGENFGEGM